MQVKMFLFPFLFDLNVASVLDVCFLVSLPPPPDGLLLLDEETI